MQQVVCSSKWLETKLRIADPKKAMVSSCLKSIYFHWAVISIPNVSLTNICFKITYYHGVGRSQLSTKKSHHRSHLAWRWNRFTKIVPRFHIGSPYIRYDMRNIQKESKLYAWKIIINSIFRFIWVLLTK